MTAIDKLISLDRKNRLRIVIVGDAMQDVYVHGRYETCQEDCPKFVEEKRILCPGGAMNAGSQLAHWNARVGFFTNGHEIQPVKTRFLVNGKIVFRHDDETYNDENNFQELVAIAKTHNENTQSHNVDRRKKAFLNLTNSRFDAMLISDYDKGFLPPEFIRQLIDLANERGVPVVCDAKREPYLYRGSILKCNAEYASRFSSLWPDLGRNVIITRGSKSPYYYGAAGPDRQPVRCVSHVGAGDCFAAHLVLALAHGLSLEDAATIAHSAGRVYVQHQHNRAPYPHEIRKDLDPVGGKVFPLSDLSALRQSVSGRIVFTNGVFRVPHAGHAWLMRWAKEQGDVLAVGVNDDDSAARVRPDEFVLPLDERIAMLASMEAVDWIVPFSEDTPVETIKTLQADMLVKGNDYAGNDMIHGHQHVKNVLIAPPGPYNERCATGIVADIVERAKR